MRAKIRRSLAIARKSPSGAHRTSENQSATYALPPCHYDDAKLRAEFLSVQQTFMEIMMGDADSQALSRICGRLQATNASFSCTPGLTSETKAIAGVVNRTIATLSLSVASLQQQTDKELLETRSSLRSRYGPASKVGGFRLRTASTNKADPEDEETIVSYDAWRRWMLDNLDNPYPGAEEKIRLLKEIPSLKVAQLNTWFSNIRRRSGWTDVFRLYAESKVSNVKILMDDIASGKEVPAGAKLAVERVKNYLIEEGRDKVSSWMNEVISKHAGGATSIGHGPHIPSTPIPVRSPSSSSSVSSTSNSDMSSSPSSDYSLFDYRASSPSSDCSSMSETSLPSKSPHSSSPSSSASSLGIGFPPTSPRRAIGNLSMNFATSHPGSENHIVFTESPSVEWPHFDFTLPPTAVPSQANSEQLSLSSPRDLSLSSPCQSATCGDILSDPFSPSLFSPPDWSWSNSIPAL